MLVTMETRDQWFDLLREVAHDLNTPITAMKGFLELVEQVGPLNERQERYLHKVSSSLQNMHQLVEMLLDIAWLDAKRVPDRKPVDLTPIVQDAALMLEGVAALRDIQIEVDVAPDLGLIMGDENRLKQAITNLVGNAVKYNRDGGTVWVSAHGEPDEVQIAVRDSGLGISDEDVPHLFDPLFRVQGNNAARIEGTGLGLAIVKGVIEKHQGRIWVESKLDEGSTFFVTLPRDHDSGEGQQEGDALEKVERQGRVRLRTPQSGGEIPDSVDDDLQESTQRQPDDVDRL
jgi:two-component system, OmpR family, phosphate regulon sensor histidine kinase PhoR